MTQIVVTLENGADSSLLRRMIENMKGVLKASIHSDSSSAKISETDEWLNRLHSIRKDIDPSVIDMDDERTRYIMSK